MIRFSAGAGDEVDDGVRGRRSRVLSFLPTTVVNASSNTIPGE